MTHRQGIITEIEIHDVRFPTSLSLDGSDAMNPDPDYSAAYVILKTDRGDGIEGHGLTFTIGRGNEVVVAAVEALKPLLIGYSLSEFMAAPGAFWKHMTGDSQLRWIGPEKGVIHLATAAIVNAMWDLWAKVDGKPLWLLLSSLTPAQIVEMVDWRYMTDALTPKEATRMLESLAPTRQSRIDEIKSNGYPAYTTSSGWLGYSDEKNSTPMPGSNPRRIHPFQNEGRFQFGRRHPPCTHYARRDRRTSDIDDRCQPEMDVDVAIEWTKSLAQFRPLWIEEPTSPDDVLGHAAIARALEPLGIGVATGEHCQNRIIFKQLLQAKAISYCQIDSCRLAGVNEVVAVLLLAAKFGIPVCPHAGGVGLCEYVQHESMFDYVCVSGSQEGRITEYVDHLHEHFIDPCIVRNGRYMAPSRPGTSIEMHRNSIEQYRFRKA